MASFEIDINENIFNNLFGYTLQAHKYYKNNSLQTSNLGCQGW